MAPARIEEPPVSWPLETENPPSKFKGTPRNIGPIDAVKFDDNLQPRKYDIFGTHPESKILFLDVNILDSTGREPYHGDVLIEGERITAVGEVPNVESLRDDPKVRVFSGRGRTLLAGLGDAHTHCTWNGGDLDRLGDLGIEEHTLLTMRSAQCFLDSGYTMCFGAASAKKRLDVVIRDAINAGDIPGPRYLANGQEIARTGGELVGGITAFADGPEEMRQVIREHVEVGVDSIKLSMSGEEVSGFENDEGMDMLEKSKTKHVVAPAINWLIGTLYEAEAFGYPNSKAEQVGYKRELEAAIAGLREMHRRGIVVLPGGDYGFAWTPHGTYARDLQHFVELLDFTPHEAIIAATRGVAALMMQSHELGRIQPGYYADCILVDGNPLDDIRILQDHSKLHIICINGRVHKAGRKEYIPPPVAGQDGNRHVIVPDMDLPEVKRDMQKQY
ncbi:hypothetical protein LTR65_009883 [Meristemomyces frigidus]